MRELVEQTAASIEAEVSEARDWTVNLHDPMWRDPKKGKSLSVYAESRSRADDGDVNRWTGHSEHVVTLIVEYMEPSDVQGVTRDQEGELAAYDVADSLTTWAHAHEAGFRPAHRMDWIETSYVPGEDREYFVRYCRMMLGFRVMTAHGNA